MAPNEGAGTTAEGFRMRIVKSVFFGLVCLAGVAFGSAAALATVCPSASDFSLTGLGGSSTGITCLTSGGTNGNPINGNNDIINTTYGAVTIDQSNAPNGGGNTGVLQFNASNGDATNFGTIGNWWVVNAPAYTSYIIAFKDGTHDPLFAAFQLTATALLACVSDASACGWSILFNKNLSDMTLYGVGAVPLPPAVILF